MTVGKWIMRRLFGTLKHGMATYALATFLMTILTGLPFALPFIPGVHYAVSISLFSEVDTIALGLVLYLGWGVVIWSIRTRCPKCGERFRYKITSRTLVAHTTLAEKEVRNYVNTYSCDNPACRYANENVPETVEISRE